MSSSPILKYNKAEMPSTWTQLQGQTIDGKFELCSFLGGSERAAVFVTHLDPARTNKAALKLVVADSKQTDALFSNWEMAKALDHPHVARLFHFGKCSIANESFAYVVMEYADEDLSMVLPSRALTPGETQEMLPAVLDALEYIHSKELVHGHIKPSNIMAVAEQVKLSSDGITTPHPPGISLASHSSQPFSAPGETHSRPHDIRSLGLTLVEVLTRQSPMPGSASGEDVLPETIPSELRAAINQCLDLNPRTPLTVQRLRQVLHPAPHPVLIPPLKKSSGLPRFRVWPYVILGLLLIGGLGWILRPRHRETVALPKAEPAQTQTVQVSPIPEKTATESSGKVAREVLPDISTGARRTIRGTIRIRLRVSADASGAVRNVRMESAGQSRYFAGKAFEAARQWTFEPPTSNGKPVPSDWKIEFQFRRSGMQAHATRLGAW